MDCTKKQPNDNLITLVCKATLYSTNFWRGKTLSNQSVQSFGEENVGDFTIANISYFS